MKKVYKIIINIIVFVFILSRLAMAETKNNIAITINDEHVEFNDNLGYPFIDSNNRSLVPFRVTLEKFGAKVSWDNTNKIAIAEKYGYKVEVPIGKSYISKDGERIEIDTSAQIIDGRTYLPIRAVFEAFGAKVSWDNDNGTVVVTYNIQDNESIISSELMKEDLDFLVKTVGEVHPSTFYGYSLNQKDIIKSLYDKIKEPLAKDEFYFNINRLVTSLNDGHTSLSYNGSKWINLPMVWTTDGIIIYEDYEDFKKGDKIISLGGLTEDVLFEELSKVLSSDNKYWIKAYGTHALSQEIYLRYFNLIHDSKVKIFIERNRQKFNISVPLENNFLNLSHKENPNWIRWELDEENSLGILYLDKCFINDEFNETLAAFMREVKNNKIKNIAVDLRNNPGGSSEVAYAFLMYTNKSNYKSFRGGIRYSPRINELINQPIERTGLNYVIAGVAMNVDFAKKINQDDSLREQFSGDIYILTSNNTFSAAVWFTILFKDNDEATIIGEPTGGKPSHFGEALDFKLPNSNFTLNISCKDFIRPDKEKVDADAMYPHYIVNTTRND
ncbi:MAG: stalk domain-containing protein, partial [Bacilli bacterium]|nr:stalk domain-containing protein [Bacilli bacterium]